MLTDARLLDPVCWVIAAVVCSSECHQFGFECRPTVFRPRRLSGVTTLRLDCDVEGGLDVDNSYRLR
jgi:hypothetical protein